MVIQPQAQVHIQTDATKKGWGAVCRGDQSRGSVVPPTIQAVLPARLQFRFLQQQQVLSPKQTQSYLTPVKLTPITKDKLLWWVNNLGLCNGRLVIQPQAQVLIQTDATKKGWGLYVEGSEQGSVVQEGTGSTYQSAGTYNHKVCHLDICQNAENVNYTYPGKQHDSLELFPENGRDKEFKSDADFRGNLGVSTWAGDHDYCRAFTRESQLQGRLGISAPERFLKMETCPLIFSKICQVSGKKPEIDLFASSLSNQLPSCYSWKPDPNSLGTYALQQKWYHKGLYALPPSALIHKVLKKIDEEKVPSQLQLGKPIVGTQNSYVFM